MFIVRQVRSMDSYVENWSREREEKRREKKRK
jgi:hypothetical protein